MAHPLRKSFTLRHQRRSVRRFGTLPNSGWFKAIDEGKRAGERAVPGGRSLGERILATTGTDGRWRGVGPIRRRTVSARSPATGVVSQVTPAVAAPGSQVGAARFAKWLTSGRHLRALSSHASLRTVVATGTGVVVRIFIASGSTRRIRTSGTTRTNGSSGKGAQIAAIVITVIPESACVDCSNSDDRADGTDCNVFSSDDVKSDWRGCTSARSAVATHDGGRGQAARAIAVLRNRWADRHRP